MKDIAICGAGPAGLSAAINAASEGLSVVLIDSNEYGGQCGQSSDIENYAGFPDGITGKELAERMVCQAAKFNVEFKCPFEILYVEKIEDGFRMGDGMDEIEAKIVIIATGVHYRRLQAKGIDRFIGAGVFYGSPSLSSVYKNSNIIVIGGANSAGQAAYHLSKCEGCTVKLIVRGDSIEKEMSEYLVDRIRDSKSIEVLCNTTIEEVKGDTVLKSAIIRRGDSTREIPVDNIFVLIGGFPRNQWVRDMIQVDEQGFILTGQTTSGVFFPMQAAEGIFAAGDVRSGSIKRVSTAVGEGAAVINDIHKYLNIIHEKVPAIH